MRVEPMHKMSCIQLFRRHWAYRNKTFVNTITSADILKEKFNQISGSYRNVIVMDGVTIVVTILAHSLRLQ